MTIEELKNKSKNLNNVENIETCLLSKIKEMENKDKFKYRGIYILVKKDQMVYIGSAYARDVRSRLLQYQQSEGSGNTTLFKDLIDAKKCDKDNVESYVKSLTVYAFKNDSLEYELIKLAEGVVNIAGNSK